MTSRQTGELPRGLDFEPGRGRAAARSGAWRSRRPMPRWCSPGRSSKTRWRSPSGSPPPLPGASWSPATIAAAAFTAAAGEAGLHQYQAGSRSLARAAARDPARRHGFRRFGDRGGERGQCRVCLGQPDRADACRPRPRRGRRGRAGRAAGQGRVQVQREYYINDAGAQVDVLARSTHLRYREALGESDRRRFPRALSRRISRRKPAARLPSATGANGSAGPRPNGWRRSATSPSSR